LPVGIVTGIRGSARARNAQVFGEYAHSGAVPQEMRRDAVLGAAEFCLRMEALCEQRRARGEDLVYASGRFGTDPARHSITKVPGELTFSIDVRSQDRATLDGTSQELQALAAEIAAKRRLRMDLGRFNISQPARMDAALQASLSAAAKELGIAAMELPSGAGHDAQDFCAAGLPCAMVFVRNDRGSHNPDEAMALDDFMLATRVLASQLVM
jgi:beta-ureidopropionase / N-carbamoyl-L-amino-acid hydrolase